jgi:hypothetical protein
MMKIVMTTAMLVALASPTLAQGYGHAHKHHAAAARARASVVRSDAIGAGFDNSARAAYGRSYDFEGWPTDYLGSRFGDFQLQGRP